MLWCTLPWTFPVQFIMTTMNRLCGKNLLKSLNSFSVVKDMVARAVDDEKPSLVKSLKQNRDKLDVSFVDLCFNYKNYKEDIIVSEKITETVFNDVDENSDPKFQFNDKWMEETKLGYYELVEKSDDALEAQNSVDDTDEKKVVIDAAEVKQKQNQRAIDSLSSQVEIFTKTTTATIDKISSEVRGMEDAGEGVAKVNSVKSDLHAISDKLDSHFNSLVNQFIQLLDDTETKEKELMRQNYINQEKVRIDSILMSLSQESP